MKGQKLSTVTNFIYLKAVVSDDDSKPNVLSWIAQVPATLTNLKTVWSDNNKAKTIQQGTVNRKRRRGRQKKRWEDNIKEWTGMDFAQLGQLKTGLDGKGLLEDNITE